MHKQQSLHAIRIRSPYYGDGQHAALHRYLDAEFINRFRQDILQGRHDQTQFSAWMQEEIRSEYDDKPVLRLPLHRAFHLVCCEVVCDSPGLPALNPQRITSSGFVVRRIGGGQEQAWMLEDGEALGWKDAPAELRDPDIFRRLCASGILHKRDNQPAYNGEQVHPLHVLDSRDDNGKRHTLLYGYLPLGGFFYLRNDTTPFDDASQQQIAETAAEALPWPFGYRKPLDNKWLKSYNHPVDRGRPSKEMFELLRLLVNRYHLGEYGIKNNDALFKFSEQLWFYDESALPVALQKQTFSAANQRLFPRYRKFSLGDYLLACFANSENNPLLHWIIEQEKTIDVAGGIDKIAQIQKLPTANGKGILNNTLFMLAGDAQELRELLGQRLLTQTLEQAQEIPLPKFAQGAEDFYQIVPFVRSLNDQGKEQIQWADNHTRSHAFRVSAPFDPEASRPALIQMPTLKDLKKGLAKGVSILTPGDTFDLINSLKLKKGASADALPDEAKPGLGIQWICSFSLPVITLVAMILLMIMISLLNIVFFWLPWVRICIPFPKFKK